MSFNTLLPGLNSSTPVTYGAIMYNGDSTALASCYPFFTSQPNIAALTSISGSGAGTITINDVDDYWTVMPGYKIVLYNDIIYGGTFVTSDNTSGSVPINYKPTSPNTVSSFQLYFKNTLIDQPGIILSTGVTVSNFANTYNVTYNSVNYRVYEFYNGLIGTLSFSASSTISNIQCLLIGGGGSGAYGNAHACGVGGGGAGAFLTTTIPVTVGDTFTINVGAGGAVPAVGATGIVGSPSSIRLNRSGAINTLTAGGGGGGGGGMGVNDNYVGPIGNPWGSTGGTAPWTKTWTVNATVASNAFSQTSAVFGTVSAFVNTGGTPTFAQPNGYSAGSGGGGAGGVGGSNSGTSYGDGGIGGAGKSWFLNGYTYAGGGGGSLAPNYGSTNGAGSIGGGGGFGIAGSPNSGSGGGASRSPTAPGKGGNGICIIAIPF
jgi:hypothetical protein